MVEFLEELVGFVRRVNYGEMFLSVITVEISAFVLLFDGVSSLNFESLSEAFGLMLMFSVVLMKSWYVCTMFVICRKLVVDIISMIFLLVRVRWAEYMKSMMVLKFWVVTMFRCVIVVWLDVFCIW